MIPLQTLVNPVMVTRPDGGADGGPDGGNEIPLILDSPHSGTLYPGDFQTFQPFSHIRRGEDTYVDDLFRGTVRHGVTFVEAMFPRIYIDPNRPECDIDPTMLADTWTGQANPSEKSKIGKGLIWNTIKGQNAEKIYDRPLTSAEIQHRIDNYYLPYHNALQAEMDRLLDKFGVVYHLDCHSMSGTADSPSALEQVGAVRPSFNLGNRDGTTASQDYTDAMMDILNKNATHEQTVSLNFPYKGVEIVKRYGQPHKNCHSLQIELSRDFILDPATLTPLACYQTTKQQCDAMVGDIANFVRATL